MKLKTIKYITCGLILLLNACNDDESNTFYSDGEMTFIQMAADNDSGGRGVGNNFFSSGDQIKVSIEDSKSNTFTYTYTYDINGIFKGSPGYRFTMDDTYITSLTADWPADGSSALVVLDQSKYEDHRRADWVTAKASTSGVMATDVPVPLVFDHNNALLEFELVGQNNQGLNITELLIELYIDNDPYAFWAYCDNDNGRASLILPGGTRIESEAGYLIGTLPGMSGDRYTITLSNLDIELERGYKYLVTLTPRGYDLDAYIYIGGWNEDRETGIGVPFHQPEEGDDGDYVINTAVQLITMSYVVRHYTDPSTIQWPTLTYTLADDFVMTEEYADLYIPIDRTFSGFSGQVIYQGEVIESIPYGDGKVLNLFVNE